MPPSEKFMIEALTGSPHPLSIEELVKEIQKLSPTLLRGKAPKKSLYSMIYRREKRRKEQGLTPKFKITTKEGISFYELYSQDQKK